MELFGSFYGMFQGELFTDALLGSVLVAFILGYNGAPLILWSLVGLADIVGFGFPDWAVWGYVFVTALFNLRPLRQVLISNQLMAIMKALGIMPHISPTERTALEAGVTWIEADLFSGRPDFKKILKEPYPELTKEEQGFIDGPVEKVLGLVNEWEVWKKRDLPPEVWDVIKKERFLGMIIPKEYGGLGFTATAHSAVIAKLATRSAPCTITVMVPNSLGPAELLLHYGTEQQKTHYLPRLARGEDIPCFALTEPTAGSDAGSITSHGVLFKGPDGKLQIRLNWNKRYITLAAISTLLGLAFRLKDPENLLGKGEDVGITCALIPTNTPGVGLGRRHDPMGVPFYNCPTTGKDVVVSVDQIVGGLEGAGHGWAMLMECLAAGRGISLPAQSMGGARLLSRLVGGYSAVRKQFGMAIGRFEGIEEPLARIGGFTYLMDAFGRFTLGALDKGIKPPVVTAIAKYNATELIRKMINDGMDIMGGAAISRGPRNLIANQYVAAPIGVTVEGANIMTRTLIIFGQGALRSHPYAFKEVNAVEKNDKKGFDRAFWGHIGHVVRNTFRAVILSVTRGYVFMPPVGGPVARYYQKLAWTSATFAIMSDVAMGVLGGALKMKEKITGRYADILSWMYIGTAVLRRWEADGRRQEDLPFVHYAMAHAFTEIQNAFNGIFANFRVPGFSWVFNVFINGWSNVNSLGSGVPDHIGAKVASLLQQDTEQRERIGHSVYVGPDPKDPVGRMEHAFKTVKKAEDIDRKVRRAVRAGQIPKIKGPGQMDEALKGNVITKEEYDVLKLADTVRLDAIQVDDYTLDEYLGVKREKDAHLRSVNA